MISKDGKGTNELCCLIIICYFQRPKLVVNSLLSIKNSDYKNWKLAFIDDGSVILGEPIVKSILGQSDRIYFFNSNDTPHQKIAQGGSRHGQFINEAILSIQSDLILIACDDDSLHIDYLKNLNDWFQAHPTEKWCYSDVIPYDPLTEDPFNVPIRPFWTNRTEDCHPSGRLDSSQVVYKTECFTKHGARYPSPQTKNLDEAIYKLLYPICGPCKFTGFYGQYKGVFEGQMGNRDPKEQYFNTFDKP